MPLMGQCSIDRLKGVSIFQQYPSNLALPDHYSEKKLFNGTHQNRHENPIQGIHLLTRKPSCRNLGAHKMTMPIQRRSGNTEVSLFQAEPVSQI